MSIQQIRRSVLVAAAVLALAVAGLFAGRLSADAFSRGHGDFAQRTFARVSSALSLTDDQKSRVKDVLRAHASEIEAQMTASRSARKALHDAVLAQPFDEAAIRSRAADIGRVQGDGAVLAAKIRAEVDPILTADQREKVKTFATKGRRHGDNAVQSFENFLKSAS